MADAMDDQVEKVSIALSDYCKLYGMPIPELRPLQKKALQIILSKKDCICSLPTGYGKSLIYELLPFIDESCLVIVIVPLNAIIQQQVKKLGEKAIYINAKQNYTERLYSMCYNFLFCHPEQVLDSIEMNRFFCSSKVQNKNIYLVVDEAHCILEWGTEFRPDFKKLYHLRSLFSCQVIALSATITKPGQVEIAKSLQLKGYEVVCSSPSKENIMLMVKQRPSGNTKGNSSYTPYDYIFIPVLQKLKEELECFKITIIYCKTMNWIGYGYELAKRILGDNFYAGTPEENNPRVVMFHSSMEGQEGKLKDYILDSLKKEDSECTIRLIFSSVALGMGADLKHVSRVIHAGPPTTLETYVQEIGRAGRSSGEADAILYYNKADVGLPSLKKDMKEYCLNNNTCRRRTINSYFGFETVDTPSNCCDVCKQCLGIEWDFNKLAMK